MQTRDQIATRAAKLIEDAVRCVFCGQPDEPALHDNAKCPATRETEGAGTETCIACSIPFKDGDRVLNDTSGGALHAACCGPERESYTNADGGPLGPDDPIPEGYLWRPWPKRVVGA